MAEMVFLLLFAIPALLGLAEILHTARLWIYGTGKTKGVLIIVPRNEDFQKTLISAARQRDWYGCSFAQRVIVVEDVLSDTSKEECRRLAGKLDFEVCTRGTLEGKITK